MSIAELSSLMEAFASWLVLHEDDRFEGCCLSSSFPLALWLSDHLGFACGVDHFTYGRLSWDVRCWRHLPQWCMAFVSYAESWYSCRPMTGAQAFDILAHIEHRVS